MVRLGSLKPPVFSPVVSPATVVPPFVPGFVPGSAPGSGPPNVGPSSGPSETVDQDIEMEVALEEPTDTGRKPPRRFAPVIPTTRKPRVKVEPKPVVTRQPRRGPKAPLEMTASGPFALGPATQPKAASKHRVTTTEVKHASYVLGDPQEDEDCSFDVNDPMAPTLIRPHPDHEPLSPFDLNDLMMFQFPSTLPGSLEHGLEGKLVKYASGRVAIHLGDVVFDVAQLPVSSFAQSLASVTDQCVLLGDVQHRFVATPSLADL